MFTVLGAFFVEAAAVDVFFVFGAAAAFFFVTRPVAVLSPAAAAAALFRARGLEVLAFVPPVALAAADLTFLVAVVAAPLFFFVVAGRDCSGAAAGTKGMRGAVMPLLPRVAAGMVMKMVMEGGDSALEDVNEVSWTRGMGWRIGVSMRRLRTRYLAVRMGIEV